MKVRGESLAVVVCEALGLDPNNTKSITFRFEPDGMMHVEATLFLTDEQELKIIEHVGEYEFVLREEKSKEDE